MLRTNDQSGPKPNMGMPERPPVTKKSKTASTEASGPDDSQAAAHSPGRIFPAGPSVNSASSTTTPAVTYLGGETNDSDAFSFNFSDRDYVFASNLGPYSTRRNLSIKSSSSSWSKQQGLAQSPARSTSMPPNLSGSALDSARRSSKTKIVTSSLHGGFGPFSHGNINS